MLLCVFSAPAFHCMCWIIVAESTHGFSLTEFSGYCYLVTGCCVVSSILLSLFMEEHTDCLCFAVCRRFSCCFSRVDIDFSFWCVFVCVWQLVRVPGQIRRVCVQTGRQSSGRSDKRRAFKNPEESRAGKHLLWHLNWSKLTFVATESNSAG